MAPMVIAALIQAGIAAAGAAQKGIAAAKQKKMAKEYEKEKRPDYQIPPSLQKATDMAKANLNPEVNKQLLQEIAANSATAINRAGKVGTSTADMLAAIGGINANENAAKRQFFGDNQQRKDAMLGQYMNALQTMAGQENKAWEWNKAQPYLNAQEAAQALHQSSAQNAAGALGDLASGAGAGAKSLMMGKQMDLQSDQMKNMMKLLGYGDDAKTKLGGDNIESLEQKGLPPLLQQAEKPAKDPTATYKITDADLLGLNRDALLPKSDRPTPPAPYEPNKFLMGEKPDALTLQALKMWNKNTNATVPAATQIAEKPTAPVIKTDANGRVFENGEQKYDFSEQSTEELTHRLAQLEKEKYGFYKKTTKQLQERLGTLEINQMYRKLLSDPTFLQLMLK